MEARKHITDKQMASLHVAYREYVRQLTEQGYDLKKALAQTVLTIPLTEENFKHYFVKPTLESLYPESSSHNDLYTDQVEPLFDVLNRAMSIRFGISIPFPEDET